MSSADLVPETPSPEPPQHPADPVVHPPAWLGPVASVRRTLAWALSDPEHLDGARFLGANCVRLLTSAHQQARQAAAEAAVIAALEQATAAFEGVDALDPADRPERLSLADSHLEEVVSIGVIGAPLPQMAAVGALVFPRRSRRRRSRGEAAAEAAATTAQDATSDVGSSAHGSAGADGSSGAAADGGESAVGEATVSTAAEPAGAEGAGDTDAAAEQGGPAAEAGLSEAQAGPAESQPAVQPQPAPPAEGAAEVEARSSGGGSPQPGDAEEGPAATPDKPEEAAAETGRGGRRRRSRRRRSAEGGEGAQARDASTSERPPATQTGPLPLDHPDGAGRPVRALDAIDDVAAAALEAAGTSTVAELLLRAPEGMQRAPSYRLGEDPPESPVMVKGKVRTRCTRLTPGARRWEVELVLPDERVIVARWVMAAPRGFERWSAGGEIGLIGVIDQDDAAAWLMLEAEPVGLDGRGSGWLPRYEIEGVADHVVRAAIAEALLTIGPHILDPVPDEVLERHRLMPLAAALRDAHFPANTSNRGRVRLAFEELLLLQLGVAARRGRGSRTKGLAHRPLHGFVGQLGALHNIQLTDGQEAAFAEIRRDLARPSPMARLLQGDVGTGKGMVALFSAVVVVENRHQVLMISPDSLAAERRFLFAESLLRSLGIVPLMGGDALTHAQADAVRRGEVHVVFGGPELLKAEVPWKRLGLVVVEERGAYGGVGLAELGSKGPRPDLLVATRVPIPTSLTLTVYGEFDLSVIPQEVQPRLSTRRYAADARDEAYSVVREQVAAGRQAYVAFPVDADGRDLLGPEDARRYADALRGEALPDARIGVYCSAMAREERARVFDDFVHRRVDVLVCTTYIEDAPDVANASVLLVEHADRHDLIRLHRLRGHVARQRHPGRCLLVVSDSPSAAAAARVERVVGEVDGFRIAEMDFQERGAEALLGAKAADAPSFRWADPTQDRALLLRARSEAFALMRADPGLRRSEEMARLIENRWGRWLATQPGQPPRRRGGRGGSRRRRRRRS